MLFDNSYVSEFIAKITQEAAIKLPFNPLDVSGLGIKNIYSYRRDIAVTMADLKPEVKVAVFQLVMNQHNRKRLVSAIGSMKELFESNTNKAASEFILRKTCGDTKSHKVGRVCTLKMDTSFPEICAMIFTAGYDRPAEKVTEALVRQLWFSSIHMNPDVQKMNEDSVKSQWDSWGKASGGKKNSSGEIIKFDQEIYNNAKSDQIQLRSTTGMAVTPNHPSGYSLEEITAWVKSVKAASTQIPESLLSTVGGGPGGPPGPESGVGHEDELYLDAGVGDGQGGDDAGGDGPGEEGGGLGDGDHLGGEDGGGDEGDDEGGDDPGLGPAGVVTVKATKPTSVIGRVYQRASSYVTTPKGPSKYAFQRGNLPSGVVKLTTEKFWAEAKVAEELFECRIDDRKSLIWFVDAKGKARALEIKTSSLNNLRMVSSVEE
jgi:hypothetical protein